MHILTTQQVRQWDEYTIRHEPIPSIELMERAATACFEWLMHNGYRRKSFEVFCAKGNNGGDGLAIARMLALSGHQVEVHILEFGHLGTPDFQANLSRLHETEASIRFISSAENIRPVTNRAVLVDALLGSGLSRPLEGLTALIVDHLNGSGHEIISIDLPSGMFADRSSAGFPMVKASHTLAFQCFKPSFLLAENAGFTGEVHILSIGLHPAFPDTITPLFRFIDAARVRTIIKPRKKHSHKGDYGHAGLISGSKGMMGAAVLCAKAVMRSGVGKLTCHVPECGYSIMQTSVPEAMTKVEPGGEHLASVRGLEQYDAIGIGPGLGSQPANEALLADIFRERPKPAVVDADGLNTLARHPSLWALLPPFSILTPHPKEFERMFGKSANEFETLDLALQKAKQHRAIIILKGANTFIASPSGEGYFNSTGNPGMATGGTGDTLTGILTGLLAQGYGSEECAIAGVYLHGRSGDLAAAQVSQHSLIASDLTDYLGLAFKELE